MVFTTLADFSAIFVKIIVRLRGYLTSGKQADNI